MSNDFITQINTPELLISEVLKWIYASNTDPKDDSILIRCRDIGFRRTLEAYGIKFERVDDSNGIRSKFFHIVKIKLASGTEEHLFIHTMRMEDKVTEDHHREKGRVLKFGGDYLPMIRRHMSKPEYEKYFQECQIKINCELSTNNMDAQELINNLLEINKIPEDLRQETIIVLRNKLIKKGLYNLKTGGLISFKEIRQLFKNLDNDILEEVRNAFQHKLRGKSKIKQKNGLYTYQDIALILQQLAQESCRKYRINDPKDWNKYITKQEVGNYTLTSTGKKKALFHKAWCDILSEFLKSPYFQIKAYAKGLEP